MIITGSCVGSLYKSNAYEQKVKTFSKGMRQKLGIAIAVIKDAPAILLDEPTARASTRKRPRSSWRS